MLEYVKMILKKVSFDLHLFDKELRKAATRLFPTELEELRNWCLSEFPEPFYPVVSACFTDFQASSGRALF